jgi:ketosteroid isomerase-like protein
MRPLLLLFALLISLPAVAQTKQTPEQEVLQVTREWLEAEERPDRATLRRIIADDFMGTGPMGNMVIKDEVIPEEGSQSGGLSMTTSDMKARIFGDTAVVTAKGVQKAGEKRALRFTVVFAKRDNRWQMVAAHLSAIPD